MQPFVEHDSQSIADAAARLRYLTGVRDRTRRAALAPSLAIVVLGAVVLIHGVLRAAWPHQPLVSIVLVAAVIAVRPLLRWLIVRAEERRGLRAPARLRLICGAAGAAAVAAALALGANPLISAIAAAGAAAAYLAGLPALGAAAIVAGAIGDLMIVHGIDPAVGELIIGASLIAIGALVRMRERLAS